METVKVTLQCKKCGEFFSVVKMCHTKLDAEIETRRISKRRNPVCAACFKKEQLEAAIEKAGIMGLPEIVGYTEKQINYAFSLRNRYIEKNQEKIKQAQKELDAILNERISPVAKKRGYGNGEDCMADAFRRVGLFEAYICLTEPNASRLILILKDIT